MSVWMVEGHSGGNETANNLAVFCERQTDRLWRWRSVIYVAPSNKGILDRNTFSFSQTHGFKNSPQITAIPSGTDSHRSGAKNNEQSLWTAITATSTQNKRLIALMANCDTPPM